MQMYYENTDKNINRWKTENNEENIGLFTFYRNLENKVISHKSSPVKESKSLIKSERKLSILTDNSKLHESSILLYPKLMCKNELESNYIKNPYFNDCHLFQSERNNLNKEHISYVRRGTFDKIYIGQELKRSLFKIKRENFHIKIAKKKLHKINVISNIKLKLKETNNFLSFIKKKEKDLESNLLINKNNKNEYQVKEKAKKSNNNIFFKEENKKNESNIPITEIIKKYFNIEKIEQ